MAPTDPKETAMSATLTPIAPKSFHFPHNGTTVYECQVPGCLAFRYETLQEALECDHPGRTATADVAHLPFGTVLESTDGWEKIANGFGGVTSRRVETATVVPPTEKQTAFVRSLLAERAGSDLAEAIRTGLNAAREAGKLDRKAVSLAIDALLQIARPVATPVETETPTATWDPSKGSLQREVLEAIPSGRYFVDGTFLKVDRPDKGRWDGFIFVKVIRNISGSFEDVKRVAILNPEASAARVDEGHRLAVETLASDPKAAAIAFGKKTGACCICGRTLTDPESVKAGIGPICAAKF